MNTESEISGPGKISRGSVLAVVVLLAYLGFEAFAVGKVRYRTEAPYIHNLLIEARTATELCNDGETALRERFERTLERATARYRKVLLEEDPDLDQPAIDGLIEAREQAASAAVGQQVQELGCTDRAIRDHLRRYTIHAKKSR